MTIEEKLKSLILERYGSVTNFTSRIDMANSTFATIMKKGIHNAHITNIIKICRELGISTDELAHNRIVPVENKMETRELNEIMSYIRLNADSLGLMLDGVPLSKNELNTFVNSLKITIDLIQNVRKEL